MKQTLNPFQIQFHQNCKDSALDLPMTEARTTVREIARIRHQECSIERGKLAMGGTIGVIQARMRSERLPGKILAPLAGKPILELIASRIGSARVDEWWLATSTDPADDVTEAWGFELGLRVFRGHESDVLSRFLAIGADTGADWCVRVTADNPFLDAAVVDALIDARDGCPTAKSADAIRYQGGLPVDDDISLGSRGRHLGRPH